MPFSCSRLNLNESQLSNFDEALFKISWASISVLEFEEQENTKIITNINKVDNFIFLIFLFFIFMDLSNL